MKQKWFPSGLGRWLLRRRKVRHARATGEAVSVGDPNSYGDDFPGDDATEDGFPLRSLVSVIVVLAAVTVIGYLVFGTLGGGSEDSEIIGSPPGTEAPASTQGTTASSSSEGTASDATAEQPEISPLEMVVQLILADLGRESHASSSRA